MLRTAAVRDRLERDPVRQGPLHGGRGGSPEHGGASAVAGGRARGGHGGDGQEALKEEKQDDEQDRDEAGELDVEGAALDAAQPVQQALR